MVTIPITKKGKNSIPATNFSRSASRSLSRICLPEQALLSIGSDGDSNFFDRFFSASINAESSDSEFKGDGRKLDIYREFFFLLMDLTSSDDESKRKELDNFYTRYFDFESLSDTAVGVLGGIIEHKSTVIHDQHLRLEELKIGRPVIEMPFLVLMLVWQKVFYEF